jgi:glucose-6-phosphate 1-dehydrogenase
MKDDCTFVIFGASGDLTKRKLIPALFSLYKQKLLPENFAVLGISRTDLNDMAFRTKMEEALKTFHREKPDAKAVAEFVTLLHYQAIDTKNAHEYAKVKERIEAVSKEHRTGHTTIFYLSTPPNMYGPIADYLAGQGLNHEDSGLKRLVVEKPFGYDLDSARELNARLLKNYHENQIYRIDHYLGKETVQNLLVFRFSNEIFDDIWNYRHIDHVEITSAEHIGVEGRGGYYDHAGVVRDMVQNHLLQVLAMTTLEPPISFDADNVRYETLKVFKSLRRFKQFNIPNHSVFGQYTSSTVKGEKTLGYRQEEGVPSDSRTETFAAFKMFIDNSRWFKVPFYLRVGKRLPTRVTEIVLHFKKTPHPAFGGSSAIQGEQNQLIIRVQPDEGILLKLGMKLPGAGFQVKNINLDFHYSELSGIKVPEPYERLLLDAIMGDATLFAHGEAVEECWKFIDPYLQYKEHHAPIYGYPSGTWGPKEAFDLLKRDLRQWRHPCKNLAHDGEYCEL